MWPGDILGGLDVVQNTIIHGRAMDTAGIDEYESHLALQAPQNTIKNTGLIASFS